MSGLIVIVFSTFVTCKMNSMDFSMEAVNSDKPQISNKSSVQSNIYDISDEITMATMIYMTN